MIVRTTPLPDLCLVETSPIGDDRGRFERLFCERELEALRPGLRWTQINQSQTRDRGTLRGMHFQHPPAAEAKMIRCLRGQVFDVAVDLRADSPTFLRWHGVELSEEMPLQVFIPEGFAHGFQTLSDDVQLLYLHTVAWNPEHEGRLRYDDPRVAIDWPLPVAQLSDKDRKAPLLDAEFAGIRL